MVVKIGPLKQEKQKNNSSRDEMHEKNSVIHLDRLWNKYRDCKGNKYGPSFGQNTGVQKKLIMQHVNRKPRSGLTLMLLTWRIG